MDAGVIKLLHRYTKFTAKTADGVKFDTSKFGGEKEAHTSGVTHKSQGPLDTSSFARVP